jgi:hypothetical protein
MTETGTRRRKRSVIGFIHEHGRVKGGGVDAFQVVAARLISFLLYETTMTIAYHIKTLYRITFDFHPTTLLSNLKTTYPSEQLTVPSHFQVYNPT